jgi:hypothetical protein
MSERYIPKIEDKPKTGRSGKLVIITVCIVAALLAGGGWYYFFGRKPKVVFSMKLENTTYDHECWSVGANEVLLIENGKLHLIEIISGKEKWSVAMPAASQSSPDMEQKRINERFAKLQVWADELARKRAKLTTAEETKAFNEEVAKYQVELTAARDEFAPKPVEKKDAQSQVKKAENSPVVANPKSSAGKAIANAQAVKDMISKHTKEMEKALAQIDSVKPATPANAPLNPVISSDVQLIQERIKRRAERMTQMASAISTKKQNAKTDIQRVAVAEEELKYAMLVSEQKAEQDALAKMTAPPAAPKPQAAPDDSIDDKLDEAEYYDSAHGFYLITTGNWIWIGENNHVVAFERNTGAVKMNVALAGPIIRVFQGDGVGYLIAYSNARTRQVARFTGEAGPQFLYVPISSDDDDPLLDNRTLFTAGDSLLRADVQLVERRVKQQDAIKPDSEKRLTEIINNSPGNSTDELKAIGQMIANDAVRMAGEATQTIDESIYEVTLRRPYEPSAAPWIDKLQGSLYLFSTKSLDFIAASTKLLAFDHSNKKVWEAALGAPVTSLRFAENTYPILERNGRIYFADGAFLTAFQAASGEVIWRVPSIGISKIQLDNEENIYVVSANHSAESLKYSADATMQSIDPLVMKITPEGKVAWTSEKMQDVWVSGTNVYGFRELKNPSDITARVFSPGSAPEARIKIFKLARNDGKPIWDWLQLRMPSTVLAHGKSVAMLYGDELQVIRPPAF